MDIESLEHPVLIQHAKHHDFGIRAANKVAEIMGSWKFIIAQSVCIALWVTLNTIGLINHWDVYPFILLNLLFSTQAAYAAPILQMAANATYKRDRDLWEHHYKISMEILEKFNNEKQAKP